jgi:hypothetical protein
MRREQPISEAPSNVYVITDEDIRQSGAIARGHIEVLDKDGLKDICCECYGEMKGELEAIFSSS